MLSAPIPKTSSGVVVWLMMPRRVIPLLFLIIYITDVVRSFQLPTTRRNVQRHHQRHPLTTSTSSSTKLGSATAASSSRDSFFTQVISDVDDTLKSSGGVNVAGVALGGIDVQYTRGDFYPGVAEFMLEISRHGITGQGQYATNASSPPKVAILTARAEEFKLALEIKDNSKLAVAFNKAGKKAGINNWGVGPVLYGSVAEWIIQFRKGLRKFTNFERLLQQDPTGMIIQVCFVKS